MNIFVVFSFLITLALIGLYGYQKSRIIDNSSSEGFFLGGRSMTALPIAGTIIMANLSTEQIVGLNGQSYVAGAEVMAWEVTAGIAIIALAAFFLPRYLTYGISTIPQLMEMRFDTTTKRIMSALTIFTYAVAFLPTVFYSGALIFNNMFQIDELLGVDPLVSVIFIVIILGIISVLFLMVGGYSLSIHTNTLFGLGLLIFGLAVPVLGLILLGNGNLVNGLEHIVNHTPELLNSVGSLDSEYVPWPTLFTGLLFNNLFFFGANQMIVQKAFTAKSLEEAQKGTLLVGVFKVVGFLIVVFPGIIARNMFGDAFLANQDAAYPALVNEVLPTVLNGFFAAVIFGAILSTVIGALMSISTLFSLDFYKGIFKPDASDKKVARVGKISILIFALVSLWVAPLISMAPQGLFNVVQEFNSLYSMPLLVLVLAVFFSKKGTAFAAKVTLVFHVIVFSLLNWWLMSDVNFLYIISILFFLDAFIFWLVSRLKPEKDFIITDYTTKVDVKPWKHTRSASLLLLALIIGVYVFLSPIGIAG